jgi:2-polyprenyl-3-methyl-5-hydroxy-6-metoxy-1,4-benzoquinol methylase
MSSRPTIRTFKKPTCMLCGAAGESLYSALEDHLFSAPGVWQLKQCTNAGCRLIWLDPAPVPEDLGIAYEQYYTHDGSATGPAPIFRRACTWAHSRAAKVAAIVTGLYQESRRFKHMLLSDLRPGKLLDVGCGDGQFLHKMSQQGWKGEGIDFDAEAVKRGREKHGLSLIAGDFQTAEFASGNFDAVTMTHVIEHVPDPVACLDKCRQLLKPGGRLVVSTPNFLSLGHQRFGRNWRGLEPPRHLQIFSPQALEECARRAALKIIRSGSTAVNADYLAKTSLFIQRSSTRPPATLAQLPISYLLFASAFQYREYFALGNNPNAGEEAFLVAERAAAT